MRKLLAAVAVCGLMAAAVWGESMVGLRRDGTGDRVYPASAFLHNGRGGNLIDVTKAPFFAKGDGVHDDTAALKMAMRFAREFTNVAHEPGGKVGGSPRRDSNWTVYLPKGTYLVSDTVSYGWPTTAMALHYGWDQVRYVRIESEASEGKIRSEFDRNRPKGAPASFGAEINWDVRVIGESRSGTVIRLKDNAPGFGPGAQKPVLSYHLTRCGSNVNYGNMLENLTIDVGRGNPGAAGVKWASSNYGAIRDVTVRGPGAVGVNMPVYNACGYFRDVLVEGFGTGFRLCAGHESTLTVEYAKVKDARVGFAVEGVGCGADLLNLRRVALENVVTNLAVAAGKGARAVVRDCDFAPDSRAALVPAAEAPALQWPPLADIATPEEYGAAGDGLHDDTAAIQRAMASGKKAVYFTRPAYAIEGTVEVPSSVTLVDGLYAGVVRHKTGRDVAMFRVAGGAAPLFEIRRLYVVGAKLVDHASPREVAVGDVFAEFPQGRDVAMREGFFFPGKFERSDVQWYAYRNAQPDVRKRVYAENCVGFCAQSEPGVTNYLENVELYARSINNERGRKGTAAYAMKNCRAWIYGAKSELCRIAVDLIDSELDMSGFNYLNWDPSAFPEHPVIQAFRSRYAIDGFFWKLKSSQPIVSRDIAADGSVRDRLKDEFRTVPGEDGFEINIRNVDSPVERE